MARTANSKRTAPAARSGKSGEASRQVQKRNTDSYALAGKSLRVALAALIVAGLSLCVGFAGWFVRPKPQYFAADASGRIIKLTPMNQPLHGPNAIENWSVRVVTTTLGIDFVHYRSQLAGVEKDFTESGFDKYLHALKNSGALSAIKSNHYVVNATLNGSPAILRSDTKNGVHFWQIKIPLMLGYQSASSNETQAVVAVVTAIRVSPERNPFQVAIQQLVVTPQ